MTRSPAWRRPAWYVYPAGRHRFLADLRARGVSARQTRIGDADPRHRGGFQVEFDLKIVGMPARHVRVIFVGPGSVPAVYCDGPAESPHRYGDGSLCMWYPWDAENARWVRRDGAGALLGHITAHLLREEWWRTTGEWIGDEAPHGGGDAERLDKDP